MCPIVTTLLRLLLQTWRRVLIFGGGGGGRGWRKWGRNILGSSSRFQIVPRNYIERFQIYSVPWPPLQTLTFGWYSRLQPGCWVWGLRGPWTRVRWVEGRLASYLLLFSLDDHWDGFWWGGKCNKGSPILCLFSSFFCVCIHQLPCALVTTCWSPTK